MYRKKHRHVIPSDETVPLRATDKMNTETIPKNVLEIMGKRYCLR